MDVEDEILLLAGEEEVLAAPPGAREPPAFQRRERRVERLQRRDVRRARPLDRECGDGVVERPPVGLDLGKLGNSSSSWTRSM
jgi:hypothetical protein